MREIVDVSTGEVKVDSRDVVLWSSPLGSCVAIVVYAVESRVGGMAHVMLPGKAPEGKAEDERCRYAADAVDELLTMMSSSGCGKAEMRVVLVGGGNVLQRKDDTICKDIIASVEKLLAAEGLEVAARDLGGIERRQVSVAVGSGVVSCVVGDRDSKILFRG